MAQAIEQNDMNQLKQLGRGQDLSQKGDQDMGLLWFAIARKNFDSIRNGRLILRLKCASKCARGETPVIPYGHTR